MKEGGVGVEREVYFVSNIKGKLSYNLCICYLYWSERPLKAMGTCLWGGGLLGLPSFLLRLWYVSAVFDMRGRLPLLHAWVNNRSQHDKNACLQCDCMPQQSDSSYSWSYEHKQAYHFFCKCSKLKTKTITSPNKYRTTLFGVRWVFIARPRRYTLRERGSGKENA